MHILDAAWRCWGWSEDEQLKVRWVSIILISLSNCWCFSNNLIFTFCSNWRQVEILMPVMELHCFKMIKFITYKSHHSLTNHALTSIDHHHSRPPPPQLTTTHSITGSFLRRIESEATEVSWWTTQRFFLSKMPITCSTSELDFRTLFVRECRLYSKQNELENHIKFLQWIFKNVWV